MITTSLSIRSDFLSSQATLRSQAKEPRGPSRSQLLHRLPWWQIPVQFWLCKDSLIVCSFQHIGSSRRPVFISAFLWPVQASSRFSQPLTLANKQAIRDTQGPVMGCSSMHVVLANTGWAVGQPSRNWWARLQQCSTHTIVSGERVSCLRFTIQYVPGLRAKKLSAGRSCFCAVSVIEDKRKYLPLAYLPFHVSWYPVIKRITLNGQKASYPSTYCALPLLSRLLPSKLLVHCVWC